MSAGTFNVCRSVWDHPVFAPSEFSEREAFLWLISEASWKPRTARVGNAIVSLERGQLAASVRFMAEAWGWSKSRVGRYLDRLKNRDMVRTESGTGVLVITLCNYGKFQGDRDTSGTAAGHERDSSGTNEKKGKKEKKDNTPPVSPPAGGEAKRGSRLPADWCLPRPWGEWAMAEAGMSEIAVRAEAAKFGDHWRAQPGAKGRKADWLATWRNWCRRAMEGRPRVKARHERTSEEDLDIRGFPDRTPRGGDEDDQRNFSRGGHQCQPAPRDTADNVSGVLAASAEEDRPLPVGDVPAGWGGVELLALRA